MSDYFERVERQIVHRVEGGIPRSSRLPSAGGYLAVVAAVLVVIVVAGVILLARGAGAGNPSPAARPAVRLVFTAPGSPSPTALEHTVQILRLRLRSVVPGAQVSLAGQRILVQARSAPPGARSEILILAAPGQLAFYDWEADAIAPNGKTVASQLRTGAPAALEISQGNGAAAPGEPGAGALPMRRAVAVLGKLASSGRRLVLVQAAVTDLRVPPTRGAANDRFYVLRAVPALSGADVENPRVSTDRNTGSPDVTFDFTAAGRRAFQAITAALARRGDLLSRSGETLNQHFAIALDDKLISVPYIDFRQYPDGITAENAVDIGARFSRQSAQTLATLLRYGPLPLKLTATG